MKELSILYLEDVDASPPRLTKAPIIIYSGSPGFNFLILNAHNLRKVVRVARAPNTVTAMTGFRASGTLRSYVLGGIATVQVAY